MVPTMRELGRLSLPCGKGGACTADEVGSSSKPKTTVQAWGDGEVVELPPKGIKKKQAAEKQASDKLEKEEGYAPLYWLMVKAKFLPAGYYKAARK